MNLLCPYFNDSVTVRQHVQYQDTESGIQASLTNNSHLCFSMMSSAVEKTYIVYLYRSSLL